MREPSSSSTSSSRARPPEGGARERGGWRAAVGFAALVAAALACVATAWLALNLARRDERIANGAALHACDFLAFKQALAARTAPDARGRVLFVGLSNVLMSVRADEIGAALERPAINFGLIANLSTGMVFEAAARAARPGDLVVLSLPHWSYQRATTLDVQQQVVKDLVFSCPTQGFWRLPLRYELTFLARQDMAQVVEAYARKAVRAVAGPQAWPAPPVAWHLATNADGGTFSSAGDWTGNRRADRRADRFARIAEAPLRLADLRVDERDESVRELRRFVREARARGVDVVAVWPAAYVGDAPRGDVLGAIRALYADMDVALLGEPEEFFYALDDFYDSPNHLTHEAASVYSARLAELLAPVAP
ncbi:MAG: hypothetical protein KC560_17225 [Myxococcales bacterium]|nr:hypothetical protein [Myxococcales bacterium]